MSRFLFRTIAFSALISVLIVALLALVWPDPQQMWADGEWRHVLRYLGVGLIVLSLLLSLRRRVFKSWGRLPAWISFHEYTATIGFFLVLFHALGYGFHALLPWILLAAMGVCVGSGLFIKWLVLRATSARKRAAGPPKRVLQIKSWRPWHLWLGVAAVALMALHAGTAYLYGGY